MKHRLAEHETMGCGFYANGRLKAKRWGCSSKKNCKVLTFLKIISNFVPTAISGLQRDVRKKLIASLNYIDERI